MPDTKHSLNCIHILKCMEKSERCAIGQRCRWLTFSANQQILGHHDDTRDVFFLVSGTVRVTIHSVSGRSVIFRNIHTGEIFGEFAAIDNQPRSATVEAVSDCVVASLSRDQFMATIESHSEINEALLQYLIGQIRALTKRVLEFSTLAVKNRLHAELLRMARESLKGDGVAIIAPVPTHAELASRISTHREAVTRELNALDKQGLVERRAGVLIIHDVKELDRMVEQVLGEHLLGSAI